MAIDKGKTEFETFDSGGGPLVDGNKGDYANMDSKDRPSVTEGPKENLQRTDGSDASG